MRLALLRLRLSFSHGSLRWALWALLAALAALFFRQSLRLALDFEPLQSTRAFASLEAAGVLFQAWLAVLLLLLVSGTLWRASARFEPLLLAWSFVLVFVVFWTFVHHGLVGDMVVAADMEWISSRGSFSADTLRYYGHPGSALIGTTVAQITGLSVLDTTLALQALFPFIFTALVYALVAVWLGAGSGRRHWLAAWAAIAFFLCSQPFYSMFSGYSAGSVGTTILFPLFVLLLLRNHIESDARFRLLIILVVPALTVTHFNSALLALLLAAGSTLWKLRPGSLTLSFAVLAAVIIASWDVLTPFNGVVYALVNMSSEALRNLVEFEPGVLYRWFLPVQTTQYTQESQPLWARVAWQFWTASFFLLSLAAVLAKVRGWRRLSTVDYVEIGGLVSIAALSLIWLFSTDVENMVNRGLMYSPFVGVPMVVRFVDRFGARAKVAFLSLAVIALAGLSFPTFLAYNASISQKMQHEQEVAGGRFLARYLDDGAGVTIYGPEVASKHLAYHVPRAVILLQYAAELRSTSSEEIWASLDRLIDDFLRSPPSAGANVIELSERWQEPFRRFLGVDPTGDARWQGLRARLEAASGVYDNGLLTYYVAGSPPGSEVLPSEAPR